MINLLFALLLAVQTALQTPPADAPRHWTDGEVRWRSIPIPTVPSGEQGVVQAQVSCTVAGRGRVRGCRIDRQTPAGTRFGRSILNGMSRAELHPSGGQRPGDTFTVTLWTCSDPAAACERLPWPED